VFHDADSFGAKSGNGSWSGTVAYVSSGVADIGVGFLIVKKEMSEVVDFTDPVGYGT
jgi:ABC-type amino acid transport substrate-binding protein